MHKYIITGPAGKIGLGFLKSLPRENIFAIYRHRRPEINVPCAQADLSTWDGDIGNDLSSYDVVLHCAAKAHIDNCEVDKYKKTQSEAWKDNVLATKNVAKFCKLHNKNLVFFSTECVFGGGKKIYSESDKLNPINWYGMTKHESEKIVKEVPNHLIIRTVMVYGKGTDIVSQIAEKLDRNEKVVAVTDQKIAFTYDHDLINVTLQAIKHKLKGVYHYSGPQSLSPYELAQKIVKIKNVDSRLVEKTTLRDYFGQKANLRLKNSILDSSKILSLINFKPTKIDTRLELMFGQYN